ncbi:MAG TPA: Na+/H+ antiporter subunit E [Acidimicrobiia bacterium]|nr:Na+/H+ antiporter subunit E [Acidimicrobiia bacterium]
MSRWRISRVRISIPTVLWIAVVWVFLWEDVSPGNILSGVLVGVAVQGLLPLPPVAFHGKVRPRWLLYLVVRFVYDLFAASFQVARLALDPRHLPHTAVVGVELRTEFDLYLFLTSEITTLVPGSVVVEALRRNGMIYVHVLDLDGIGGVEAVRRNVLATEERVLKALASDAELEAAGITLGGAS